MPIVTQPSSAITTGVASRASAGVRRCGACGLFYRGVMLLAVLVRRCCCSSRKRCRCSRSRSSRRRCRKRSAQAAKRRWRAARAAYIAMTVADVDAILALSRAQMALGRVGDALEVLTRAHRGASPTSRGSAARARARADRDPQVRAGGRRELRKAGRDDARGVVRARHRAIPRRPTTRARARPYAECPRPRRLRAIWPTRAPAGPSAMPPARRSAARRSSRRSGCRERPGNRRRPTPRMTARGELPGCRRQSLLKERQGGAKRSAETDRREEPPRLDGSGLHRGGSGLRARCSRSRSGRSVRQKRSRQ